MGTGLALSFGIAISGGCTVAHSDASRALILRGARSSIKIEAQKSPSHLRGQLGSLSWGNCSFTDMSQPEVTATKETKNALTSDQPVAFIGYIGYASKLHADNQEVPIWSLTCKPNF